MSRKVLASVLLMVCVSTAHAVHVTSSNVIRIDFTPSFSLDTGWFTGAFTNFTFALNGDRLDSGEGWTVTAYNNSDQVLGVNSIVAGPIFGGFTVLGTGLAFSGTPGASEISHLIYTNILGSFDLESVELELHYIIPSANPNFGPQFGFQRPVEHTLSVFAVPAAVGEPSSIVLLSAALMLLLRSRRAALSPH
jgi:hypothetical protein